MKFEIQRVSRPLFKLRTLNTGEFFVLGRHIHIVVIPDKDITHCLRVETTMEEVMFSHCSFSEDHLVELIPQDSIKLTIDL
jgi:hypothetical protein